MFKTQNIIFVNCGIRAFQFFLYFFSTAAKLATKYKKRKILNMLGSLKYLFNADTVLIYTFPIRNFTLFGIMAT